MLNLKAHAMIYYLNYNDPSMLKYRLHLVKSSKEEYTYEAENFACPVNYSQALKSSYDMTYICFSLEADITELSGSYDMILEIENMKKHLSAQQSENAKLLKELNALKASSTAANVLAYQKKISEIQSERDKLRNEFNKDREEAEEKFLEFEIYKEEMALKEIDSIFWYQLKDIHRKINILFHFYLQ